MKAVTNLQHQMIFTEVLLRNNKRKDRKGGKFTFKWSRSYVVSGIENPINLNNQTEQPTSEEKPVENIQNRQIPDGTPAVAINGRDKSPNQIVEKIQAIKRSDHVCETHSNIINSSS